MSTLPVSPITKARLDDFEELKTLLQKANNYSLEISGIPQWTKWDVVFEQLRFHLKNESMFVVRDPTGAIILAIALDDADEQWGEASADGLAVYLHQLMKDPAKAPHGSGIRLIEFAATYAIKRQKTFLRADTTPELIHLIAYYNQLGFEECGTFIYESSGRPGVLLEARAHIVLERTAGDD